MPQKRHIIFAALIGVPLPLRDSTATKDSFCLQWIGNLPDGASRPGYQAPPTGISVDNGQTRCAFIIGKDANQNRRKQYILKRGAMLYSQRPQSRQWPIQNEGWRIVYFPTLVYTSNKPTVSRLTPYTVRASVRLSLRYDEHIESDISMKLWSIDNKIAAKRENTQQSYFLFWLYVQRIVRQWKWVENSVQFVHQPYIC